MESTQASLEQQQVILNTMQSTLQIIATHLNTQFSSIAEGKDFNNVDNLNEDIPMNIEKHLLYHLLLSNKNSYIKRIHCHMVTNPIHLIAALDIYFKISKVNSFSMPRKQL